MAADCIFPIVLVDDNETSLECQRQFLLAKGFPNVVIFDNSRQVMQFLDDQDAAVRRSSTTCFRLKSL